jgi:hypothetical protein
MKFAHAYSSTAANTYALNILAHKNKQFINLYKSPSKYPAL